MKITFAAVRDAVRGLRILHRVGLVEAQLERFFEQVVVCEGCATLMHGGHLVEGKTAVRVAIIGGEAKAFCRFCFQKVKGDAIREARAGRPVKSKKPKNQKM